jgi:hypothetical protein
VSPGWSHVRHLEHRGVAHWHCTPLAGAGTNSCSPPLPTRPAVGAFPSTSNCLPCSANQARTASFPAFPAGTLYRLLPQAEKDRLHEAIAGAMEGVPREIIGRQLAQFDKADPANGKGVRAALKP